MSELLRLFENEYAIDGHYLQYIDSYPTLQMIKNVPEFLKKTSENLSQASLTNFVIGGLNDNNNIIQKISSITKNLDYKKTLNDAALSVLLYNCRDGDVNNFIINESDHDLLKSMNGTLENYLIEGMENSNILYQQIITDYVKKEEFPAHFHNISQFLKRNERIESNGYNPVWKMLTDELKYYCLGKK